MSLFNQVSAQEHRQNQFELRTFNLDLRSLNLSLNKLPYTALQLDYYNYSKDITRLFFNANLRLTQWQAGLGYTFYTNEKVKLHSEEISFHFNYIPIKKSPSSFSSTFKKLESLYHLVLNSELYFQELTLFVDHQNWSRLSKGIYRFIPLYSFKSFDQKIGVGIDLFFPQPHLKLLYIHHFNSIEIDLRYSPKQKGFEDSIEASSRYKF